MLVVPDLFCRSLLYLQRMMRESMSAIEVEIQPAIFRNHKDVWYGIAGSVWVEVPKGTTLDELSQYMVYKPREVAAVAGEKTWSVKGSKGNVYTVKLSEGTFSCTCPGYGFRRKCRHITEIKNESKQ